ncbi:CoA transferase [Streptomyces sp. B-S-A8]|uniref:CoA transferase n=1 Tax=Streptomyces solicavernae TaxID=3043614 RepID=A0ABT6RXQ1_9ACTN|nr:CoA transferase [Streptomyces sp. B-S-A8]MDI3389167.1 CoA transferase [Streptomyces sp. B-S-A8]
MTKPLDGVRVIDFGQFIAAPAAAQLLGDMGADVIKVEPVHGESARVIGAPGQAMLNAYSRNKRGVALDLKDPRGLRIAEELIAGADIVVQNLRPGVMESLGLGARTMRARHPALVYATVSGFGLHGPSRLRAGLDIAAQAESGIMSVTGERDREPQKVGFQVVDSTTAHVCAQAVLGAYVRRLRTGHGDEVEVSLLEVAVHLQAPNWGTYLLTGKEPVRTGNGQPALAPAADVMPNGDGALVVSAYSDAHFERLCRLLGRPELALDERFATNAARVRHRPEMLAELRSEFATMTTDDAMRLLTENGVVAGRINSYGQTMASPDVEASGIFIRVTDVAGRETTTLGSPWHLGSVPEPSGTAAPELGQHTAEVLAELGYARDAVRTLEAAGVVHTYDAERAEALAPSHR